MKAHARKPWAFFVFYIRQLVRQATGLCHFV